MVIPGKGKNPADTAKLSYVAQSQSLWSWVIRKEVHI